MNIDLLHYQAALEKTPAVETLGTVRSAIGLAVEACGVKASIGDYCHVKASADEAPILTEVVGFRNDAILLMPFGVLHGIRPGAHVQRVSSGQTIPMGPALLGRVIDALGSPIDGKGPLVGAQRIPLQNSAPMPLERPRIANPLPTGVRVLDAALTAGKGQRMGIFSGSGVGKSTLLGMIARGAQADIIVIGLIGERGREAQEFIEKNLGKDGLARSVLVIATSDQPAVMRLKAAWTATAVAEAYRDSGKHVLLLLDSLTRVAMAQREIGLATGEPPALRGYTPSVFALIPRLIERAGAAPLGVISAFYTVLVEGDDMNEPIADTARGVLDGHIVLSRALAAENIFPSIDILHSISRVMPDITEPRHMLLAGRLRDALATYEKHKDLITIGAYQIGSNQIIDRAIALQSRIIAFQRQEFSVLEPFEQSIEQLDAIFQY